MSEDCETVTGDYRADRAIVLGSLFSLRGAQASTNRAREASAQLALDHINDVGGIPSLDEKTQRPLVLVSCDASQDLKRAGNHLVQDLEVPAIIGPNTSEDTIALSNSVTSSGGTLILSPTAVASSVGDLLDNGLTWTMVPSDAQRGPLLLRMVGDLEQELRTQPGRAAPKLSVIYRDDALGLGTRDSLSTLSLQGKPVSELIGSRVRFEGYRTAESDRSQLLARTVDFAPDIVVLAGTAEAVTEIMVPLEESWRGGPRPFYVLIDSLKVPELLVAAQRDDDLRTRIRGTGTVPTARSQPVYDAFRIDYAARHPDAGTSTRGLETSYDALYAVAYALAATQSVPPTGPNIAMGLRRLSGGSVEVELQPTKILAAFQLLVAGQSIEAIGSQSRLEWDARGTPTEGTIEAWCIAPGRPTPFFQGAGLTVELRTQHFSGSYGGCEVPRPENSRLDAFADAGADASAPPVLPRALDAAVR